jgi:hypothetical protein
MSTAGAQSLLEWLEACDLWEVNDGAFYSQESFVVKPDEIGNGLSWVFDPTALIALKERLETAFECRLGSRFRFVAQSLRPGQGIGIHNDSPRSGYETLRLICYVGRGFDDRAGGHLLLLRGGDAKDVEKVVRPLHGTYAAFPLSESSFHAVTDIVSGRRFSFLVSFWHDERCPSHGCKHRGDDLRSAARSSLVPLLEQAGAGHREHSGRDLLRHLLGTLELLIEWGAETPVCLAGLLHSVIGAGAEPTLALTGPALTSTAEFAGTDCLEIVERYARVVRRGRLRGRPIDRTLYEVPRTPGALKMVVTDDGSIELLEEQQWADLVMIDVANSVEQIVSGTLPDSVYRDIGVEIRKVEWVLPDAITTSVSFRRAMQRIGCAELQTTPSGDAAT